MNPFFIITTPLGLQETGLQNLINMNKVAPYTTRPKKVNEKHGINYYFISRQEFNDWNRRKKFVYVEKKNNYAYGITLNEIWYRRKLSPAYVIVPTKGMKQLKKIIKDAITIYIDTTIEDFIKINKQNNIEEDISKITKRYNSERKHITDYDYIIHKSYDNELLAIKQISQIASKYSTPIAFSN